MDGQDELWECEGCYEEFTSEKETVEHEKTCTDYAILRRTERERKEKNKRNMSGCGKVCYESKGQARRAAGQIFEPYHCKVCKAWHLATVDKKMHKSFKEHARGGRSSGKQKSWKRKFMRSHK